MARPDSIGIGDTIQLYESDENPTGVSRKWAYQYSGGAWAFAYLTHLRSENLEGILINYWRDLAELEKANQGEGYRVAFQQTFGMSLEDLYTDFDAFMRLPRTKQLAILEDWQAHISHRSHRLPLWICGIPSLL